MNTPTIPTRPTQNRRARQLTSTQVTFAVIVAIGLMLAINFSDRITADRELDRVHEAITQEIDLLKREQAVLIDELAFVQSEDYVEAWARSEGRMVRSGEVLVRLFPLVADESLTTVSTLNVPSETSPPQPEPWMLWWALFMDEPPPTLNVR